MRETAYMLFETALGRCGVAWGENGVRATSFPHETDAGTRKQLFRRGSVAQEASPPSGIAKIIDDIAALFTGEKRDLSYVSLDMNDIGVFERDVYALSLQIKAGELKTYGDLAVVLGDVSLSRRVGQALGRNPFPIIVPCHRIVGADGAMTGFSAPGGAELKRKLLKIEGALAPDLLDAL